jgi:hypothetical protein
MTKAEIKDEKRRFTIHCSNGEIIQIDAHSVVEALTKRYVDGVKIGEREPMSESGKFIVLGIEPTTSSN